MLGGPIPLSIREPLTVSSADGNWLNTESRPVPVNFIGSNEGGYWEIAPSLPLSWLDVGNKDMESRLNISPSLILLFLTELVVSSDSGTLAFPSDVDDFRDQVRRYALLMMRYG